MAEVEGSTPSPTTICENCKKCHNNTYGSGRFCSEECARSYATILDKKQKKLLKCKSCSTFIVVGKRSRPDVYCKKCLIERKKKYKKTCKYCKQPYKTVEKESIYCCKKCSNLGNKNVFKKYAIKNKLGGHTSKKSIYYICTDGTVVYLQSNYEVIVAKSLDKNNIKWIRPHPLIWKDKNNINHRYYPDFYLPDYNIYLDPKNPYLIKKDKNKIQEVMKQNKIIILLLEKNSLTWSKIKNLL